MASTMMLVKLFSFDYTLVLKTKEKTNYWTVSSQISDFVIIGYFRIIFGLFFKVSPGAHPFIRKLVFIDMQMKANWHMKT